MAAIHGTHIGNEKQDTVGITVRESRYGRITVFVQRVFQVRRADVKLIGSRNRLFADGVVGVVGIDDTQIVRRNGHTNGFQRFADTVFLFGS